HYGRRGPSLAAVIFRRPTRGLRRWASGLSTGSGRHSNSAAINFDIVRVYPYNERLHIANVLANLATQHRPLTFQNLAGIHKSCTPHGPRALRVVDRVGTMIHSTACSPRPSGGPARMHRRH